MQNSWISYTFLVGDTFCQSLTVFYKVVPYNPANPFLGIYPREMKRKHIHTKSVYKYL